MATTTKINGVWHTSNNIGGGSQGEHPYLSLERLCPYLYKVTFDAIPQDNGNNAPVGGGCSSYVRNGKLYRNFDFKYDNAASFIVRTKDFEGMAMLTGLNDGQMDDALIAQLPYRMVDGRNNEGIMVSVHLLFNDWEYTGAGQKSIPMTRLPFEVLSRVKSMATIGTDLADVLGNLNVTIGMGDYLLQCLVTDGTTTYAIIPPDTDNSAYALINATAYPKMSNFRYVARAEVSRYDMDLQDRPTGIERYNLMPCELSDLRFTKAYETADRLSEFIGLHGTTKESTDAELEAIYEDARSLYLDRERDGQTWQTMHSVVYGNKMESLFIQEDWADDILDGGDYIEKPSSFTPGHLAALDSDGNLEDGETGLDASKKYGRMNGQWVEISGGGSGTSDFDELTNRPKYNGTAMTHSTDIPAVPTISTAIEADKTSDAKTTSPKAVYDFVDGLVGDIVTLLAAI